MKKFLKGLELGICILGLVACGDHPDRDQKHETEKKEEVHDSGSVSSGATYEEGKGIKLMDETKESLGLELFEVPERPFQSEVHLTAQVYRSATEASKIHGQERQGNAYATALLAPEVAKQLQPRQKFKAFLKNEIDFISEGIVFKVDPAQLSSLGRSETILEVPDPKNRLKVGDFIEVEVPFGSTSPSYLSIPRSAVLEASTGTFVFVKNGDYLLRTEIKIGAENKDLVEIKDGLYEGDIIALKPVETLYLIELRAVKGGGHCH